MEKILFFAIRWIKKTLLHIISIQKLHKSHRAGLSTVKRRKFIPVYTVLRLSLPLSTHSAKEGVQEHCEKQGPKTHIGVVGVSLIIVEQLTASSSVVFAKKSVGKECRLEDLFLGVQVQSHVLWLGVDPLERVVLVPLVLLIAKSHEDGDVCHLATGKSPATAPTDHAVKK